MSGKLILPILLLIGYTSFSQVPLPEDGRWTSSGIRYKIMSSLRGCTPPGPGDVIWMHLEKLDDTGQAIFSTRQDPFFSGGVEVTVKEPSFNGDIMEIFTLMCDGDSAVAIIPVDSVDRDLPAANNTKDKWYTYYLKLIRSLSPDENALERQFAIAGSRHKDSIMINTWLSDHNIFDFVRDSNGIVWAITASNTKSKRLKPGNNVSVHYRLKLYDDTLIDDSYSRGEPFTFSLGKRQVIDGWDLGLLHFGVKEKGVLIIPSYLGYGRQGSGGAIPPDAILVFEVEIVAVN